MGSIQDEFQKKIDAIYAKGFSYEWDPDATGGRFYLIKNGGRVLEGHRAFAIDGVNDSLFWISRVVDANE